MPENKDEKGTAAQALKPAPPAVELRAADLRGPMPLGIEDLVRAAREGGGDSLLGQERALDAVRLAIGVEAPGYSVFVSGMRSRREQEPIIRLLKERAATLPTPGD